MTKLKGTEKTIAAVTNALEGREFPFVFGGDGASFAIAPRDLESAREALAQGCLAEAPLKAPITMTA